MTDKKNAELPTSTKILVADLEQKPKSFDRDEMIRRARRNKYHDFLGDEALNIQLLVVHARRLGYEDIAQQAMSGKYDATKEESKAWAESPEGREVYAEFGGDAFMKELDAAHEKGGIEAAVKVAVKKGMNT